MERLKHMFNHNDLMIFLSTCLAMLVEQFIKHPIGGLVAVLGLLYSFERYRTQRLERKIKEREYENQDD